MCVVVVVAAVVATSRPVVNPRGQGGVSSSLPSRSRFAIFIDNSRSNLHHVGDFLSGRKNLGKCSHNYDKMQCADLSAS